MMNKTGEPVTNNMEMAEVLNFFECVFTGNHSSHNTQVSNIKGGTGGTKSFLSWEKIRLKTNQGT